MRVGGLPDRHHPRSWGGDMTYSEITRIARKGRLPRYKRMKKLEGCLRRLMTEIIHRPPRTTKARKLYEYKFIHVAREIRDLYK